MMRKQSFKIAKLDPTFIEKARQTEKVRYIKGMDKKPAGLRRISQAIARYPPIWKIIEEADFIEDKKGQFNSVAFNIFLIMIFGFLVIMVFAGWIYIQGLLANVFHDTGVIGDQSGIINSSLATNMTGAADLTFGSIAESIKSLRMVAAVYIIALLMCIMITNALIKVSPFWFFAYIILSVLAIIVAVPISNAYENLLSSTVFGGELTNFTVAGHILLHLPLYVFIVTMLGGIFLFVNLVRVGNENNLLTP